METRNYGNLSDRLSALSAPHIAVETTHSVGGYPIYTVRVQRDDEVRSTILLTAGLHGDEPAGVEAVLRFLASDHDERLRHYAFRVLPCINPTGYVNNTRENAQGVDLNREFESDDATEVCFVKATLSDQQFDYHVDFHEDWEATGFYLYEGTRNGESVGEKIIQRVQTTVGPIDPDHDGDEEPISPGVYPVSSSWGTKGLSPYVLKFHALHAIICETPTRWPIDQRVEAHLAALDTVLAHHHSRSQSGS